MTCSDVQRVLPEILEGAPSARSQSDFQAHLKSCADCSDLVSDLDLIASEARQLEASEEPAPRVWLRIAAELRAEGIIRESGRESGRERESAPARPILVPTSPRRRWNAWWLAPVAAALLAAGAYVISHQPAPQTAMQSAPGTTGTSSSQTPAPAQVGETATAATVPAPTPPPQQLAQKSAPPAPEDGRAVAPAPSADDQQFLSVVSTVAPSMRATYENQLQVVNADIRETQAYVDQYPRDADARQHLMDAYEQKALLYQIALDRIQ